MMEIENNPNHYIKVLVIEQKYPEIVSYLEKRHQIRKLNLYEAYVYKISSAIVRIKQVNKIPKLTAIDTTSMKEAIIGNNYRLALKLIDSPLPELSNPEEKNIVLILLKEINRLITKVIKDSNEIIKKEQEDQDRKFLLEQLDTMRKSQDIIIILKNLDSKRISKLIQTAKNIPELSVFSTGYKGENLALRLIDKSQKISNKKKLLESALNAYVNRDYELAISIYRSILLYGDYIKADTCGMLGLSYLHVNNIEEAIKYMTLSIELDKGYRNNKVDYKTLIRYLQSSQTEEIQDKIKKIVDKHDSKLIEYDFTDIKELAYCISSQGMTLDTAIKEHHLLPEQILLIKLIYAIDYYIEKNYTMGDQLVEEVAEEKEKTLIVIFLLAEVRRKRNSYQQEYHSKKKALIQQ